ncbi:MAG: flagellar hook-basal body complex protein FliE [Phycisphaerae bacterium]
MSINTHMNIRGLSPVSPASLSSGTDALRSPAGKGTDTNFADTLKASIDEVVRLQQDAGSAVRSLATGQTDDITGVMTAVEKSSLAFKTLLAIRGKLMDAYEEVKNMPI